MKTLILLTMLIGASAFGQNSTASEAEDSPAKPLVGKLIGFCVQNQTSYPFEVMPGEKYEWGFELPRIPKPFKIVVLNNSGSTFEKGGENYSAAISVTEDGKRVSDDLLLLCPRAPKDKKEACLEHNKKISERRWANREKFGQVKSDGQANALLNSHRDPDDGKLKYWWERSSLNQRNISDGETRLNLDFGSAKLGSGKVECIGHFVVELE